MTSETLDGLEYSIHVCIFSCSGFDESLLISAVPPTEMGGFFMAYTPTLRTNITLKAQRRVLSPTYEV